jgi:hypothetical protein
VVSDRPRCAGCTVASLCWPALARGPHAQLYRLPAGNRPCEFDRHPPSVYRPESRLDGHGSGDRGCLRPEGAPTTQTCEAVADRVVRGAHIPVLLVRASKEKNEQFIALVATPILWGEEFGWRGYLQIRLLGHRPLLAAVSTGLIWGVWHYPINLRGYNYPDQPILGLFVFPVGAILLSIIFGWLRLRIGSVWSASLAHSATNAIGGSLTMLLFMGGPNWISVSYLGLLGWVPLGALCAWIVFSGQLKLESAQE